MEDEDIKSPSNSPASSTTLLSPVMPLTYTHPLSIDEILRRVIAYVASDVIEHFPEQHPPPFDLLSQSSSRTLASAALVNKTFSLVALDALYRNIDFFSILRVLGDGNAQQLCEAATRSLKENKELNRLPVHHKPVPGEPRSHIKVDAHGWARFKSYFDRVRGLRVDCTGGLPSVLELLQTAQMARFPPLTHLEIVGDDTTLLASLKHLLTPSMKHLHIINPALSWEDHVSSATDSLSEALTSAPNLLSLYVDGVPTSSESLSAISCLRYLRTLHLYPVLDHALAAGALSKLENLQLLELTLLPGPDSLHPQSSPRMVLPQLAVAHIVGPLQHVAHLVSNMHLPQVEKVDISTYPELSPGDEHSLIQTIASKVANWAPSVRILSLDLELGNPDRSSDRGAKPLSTLLSPLVSAEYPYMESVDLQIHGVVEGLRFTDEDVVNMATAWPTVEDLSVVVQDTSDMPSITLTAPSFASFKRLPQLLPRLKTLRLGVELCNIPGEAELNTWLPFESVSCVQLFPRKCPSEEVFDENETKDSIQITTIPVHVGLADSSVDSFSEHRMPEDIARVVATLFPKIDLCSSDIPELDDGCIWWHEVLEEVQGLRSRRNHVPT